jgi:hypothetical protein
MRLYLLLLLPANLILLSSCKKYAPADAAFFLKPGLITVATTTAQGSGSHKITDLWLYVNGQFQGAYPVENTMPIVTKGVPATINILAGIKKNGIADTRTPLRFYDMLQFDTLVESGKTITRPFTFRYVSITNFTWIEDFDRAGLTLTKSLYYSDTTFKVISGTEAFEGQSAELGLSPDTPIGTIAQVESTSSFTLPKNTGDVFLELNYKCNDIVYVGLVGDGEQLKSVINLKPQAEWNKIYIQLAEGISVEPVSSKYKVYFSLVKNAGQPSPKVYLDNIKLIYII